MTTFLYVEDDPGSRKMIHTLMTTVLGYDDITIFEDSSDFITRAKSLPATPDLIFLDIHIKPYDGYEMLKMLQADPRYNQTRIIAMTASVMTEEIQQLKEAGFHGLISKPIRKKLFPELLQRILAGESVWVVS